MLQIIAKCLPLEEAITIPPVLYLRRSLLEFFTPLIESRTKLFERLTAAGYIHPVGPKPVNTTSKFYRPYQRCAYHSNSVGHDTEDCVNLKHKIQDLIDQNVVSLQTVAPNVNRYIHPVGPKPVDTSSRFYRPDQRCACHSNSVGHDTEDCVNLKHKIQDLIDQNVVSLQTVAPNAIVSIAPDELESVVASLSIREKKEFVILTPEKAVALVPRETLTQPKFVIETAVTQGMTRSGRCCTPEELAQGGQKKDQTKRTISKAEAEEFWRKMQPKDYSIVKHLEKKPAQIFVWALLMSSQLHRQFLLTVLDDTYVPVGTNSDNLVAMINRVIRGHRISFCDEELPFEGRMHNKALHVTIKCWDKVIDRVLVDDGSGLNICPLSTLMQLKFDLGKVQQNQVNVRALDGVQRDTIGAVNWDIQMGPAEFNVEFQVLDINTSYNLLLERPVRHQELVIHGEGSHSDGYALIVHEVSRGCDFYTVELVNVTGDDLAPQHLMPVVYKMIATIILQNGFKPGFGLGKHFQGIVEPIQVPARGVKFGLGYVPTDADKAEMKNKSHADDGGLGEGIWGLFEDIDAVIEEEAGTSGIRDAEPDEQMQNWTSTPLLISRSSGMDPLKNIFQKAMLTGKLTKWQMFLNEFDIVYVTQKAIKAQVLAGHLAENPVDEEYEPLKTYFPDEEITFVGEDISEAYPGWRVFFDGAANHQGK
ncbi:uncharacterized protein [Solanum tuberosum]|uniref:uncharacterized protein n=1 Tax=Solanum tuberosum TaxID=4113 RepID=UPI00073A129A|nr:PREDICTED: uncharacterized protein LOC107061817 [Solanum tuberosum]